MSRQIVKKEKIATERLTVAPYRTEDRERLAELLQNPKISATFMIPDYTEKSQFLALADKLITFSKIGNCLHREKHEEKGEPAFPSIKKEQSLFRPV